MYNECNSNLLNGLINQTELLDAYICKDCFSEENFLDRLEVNISKNELAEILKRKDKPVFSVPLNTISYAGEHNTVNIRFNTFEDWIELRKRHTGYHTKLAVIGEEILLTKVKDLKNIYVLFWFSTTRNNSILRFRTNDSLDTVKKEVLDYLKGLEFESIDRIPVTKYSGWLRSWYK